MTSKAAKRRAKRGGRPRLKGARRPDGRLSESRDARRQRQEMTEVEAKAVALDARARHTGLAPELLDLHDAGRPNAGTLHGVMLLRNELTADQWTAAEFYIGRRDAYLRAIDAPGRPMVTGDKASNPDPDAFAAFCRKMIDEWAGIIRLIQDLSTEHRSPIQAAFDEMLVKQVYLDHMVGDLRIGLNGIYRAYCDGRKSAAA